jgi:hypothetical protein
VCQVWCVSVEGSFGGRVLYDNPVSVLTVKAQGKGITTQY